MVREDLPEQDADAAGGVKPVVEERAGALKHPVNTHDRSQKLGPTGSLKPPVATR